MKITRIKITTIVLLVATLTSMIYASDYKTFKVKNYNIEFTFPTDWKPSSVENPFDLQVTNQNAYFSVFAYEKVDLAENETPLDIFKKQNADILGKRENVKKVSDMKIAELKDAKIYSELHSAEKKGVKNYYYFNLVEFKNDSSVFLWVLLTGVPSYALKNLNSWNQILSSVRFTKN